MCPSGTLRTRMTSVPPPSDRGHLGHLGHLGQDFPYALNGLVPLAAASKSPRLAQQCTDAVRRVLETGGPPGAASAASADGGRRCRWLVKGWWLVMLCMSQVWFFSMLDVHVLSCPVQTSGFSGGRGHP